MCPVNKFCDESTKAFHQNHPVVQRALIHSSDVNPPLTMEW